jgi:hypothetical protein
MKVEKRTMSTVFNSGNSHVVDHTSLQNLVSVYVRRPQLNMWYLSVVAASNTYAFWAP